MTTEERKLLKDILESAQSIDEYLEGRRVFTEFKESKIKRRAIERELEIIGEATNNLLKINPEIPLTHARLIVNPRNRVIHAYDAVDEIIIWKIVVKDIPVLIEETQTLLLKG